MSTKLSSEVFHYSDSLFCKFAFLFFPLIQQKVKPLCLRPFSPPPAWITLVSLQFSLEDDEKALFMAFYKMPQQERCLQAAKSRGRSKEFKPLQDKN
jgi:hypothetical protein